ncbi:uncharacterized protein LOC129792665 [Lutzomyia longipalpis]|uniref:uncharacterized protein LOC129792665 n=1 Tax=Lutzomyia longipalpis TaxID=7200 RepID=UPI002484657D|nr:uncharacterized protein LOC129792665 [Lutzomyia longipalpis]
MASGAGVQQSLLDAAFDRIGKKYPSFKRETGRKMIDGLSGAYKSFKNRRQKKENDDGSPTSEEEMKLLEKECVENPDKPKTSSETESSDEPSKELVPWKKPEESDDCDYLTAEEDDEDIKKDTGKVSTAKPPEDPNDPEKGIPPDSVVDCGPAGVGPVGPHHKGKGVDISQYLQKKSMAQGMLDLALLSANTNQLRYILETRGDNVYFIVSITLIISSLVLQVAVGIMLIWSHRFNMRKRSGMASADRINNLSVLGVFLITLINVFISTFGGSSASGAAPAPSVPGAPSAPGMPPDHTEAPKLPPMEAPIDPGTVLA